MVFLILSLVSFLIRLPFFFRDYIDRDESTFILMGQSWVDGHLPYTELWDLKPPITFLFFAAIIYSFGKSFFAIRLFGALLVASTAFFSFKIGASVRSKKVGFWAGIFCVILQSMFGSIQGVMSEHICMAFFMPGLYFLVKSDKAQNYLIAGLFMGLAIMTKLNIAYAVLFVGIYIPAVYFKRNAFFKGLQRFVVYGIGILSIVLLIWLPYYFQGISEVWWKSVVLAALEYADARRDLVSLAPTFLLLAAFFVWTWQKKFLDFNNDKMQLLLVSLLGVLLSFYKAGRINSHYLIQLYPILVILIAITISKVKIFHRLDYAPYVFFLFVLLPAESYLEYFNIVKNKMERGTFYNGEGITVPDYLLKKNLETKNILFLGYHIGYWKLGATPPTKAATHPSNICRNELFPYFENPRITAVDELEHIMDEIRPRIVVTRKNRLVFHEKMEAENKYIDSYLDVHYKVLATVDGAKIYERLE